MTEKKAPKKRVKKAAKPELEITGTKMRAGLKRAKEKLGMAPPVETLKQKEDRLEVMRKECVGLAEQMQKAGLAYSNLRAEIVAIKIAPKEEDE
jgi:hypothetical protein